MIAEYDNCRNPTIKLGLTQWDYGQELTVLNAPDGDCEVHFALDGDAEAVRVQAKRLGDTVSAKIPNSMLRDGRAIMAYIYIMDEASGETVLEVIMPVTRRARPKDYNAPEDEDIIAYLKKEITRKADNIKLDSGKIQLTSDGNPIGEAIELPESGSTDIDAIPNESIDEIMEGDKTWQEEH